MTSQVPSPLSTQSISTLLGPSTATERSPGPAFFVSTVNRDGTATTPFLIPAGKLMKVVFILFLIPVHESIRMRKIRQTVYRDSSYESNYVEIQIMKRKSYKSFTFTVTLNLFEL